MAADAGPARNLQTAMLAFAMYDDRGDSLRAEQQVLKAIQLSGKVGLDHPLVAHIAPDFAAYVALDRRDPEEARRWLTVAQKKRSKKALLEWDFLLGTAAVLWAEGDRAGAWREWERCEAALNAEPPTGAIESARASALRIQEFWRMEESRGPAEALPLAA